jgi:hypothetical protein
VEDTPSKICDKGNNASFEVTYITPETKEIHQLKAEFDKNGLFGCAKHIVPLVGCTAYLMSS